MKVQVKHGKVTQNMHGASRNYRYVWDVSTAEETYVEISDTEPEDPADASLTTYPGKGRPISFFIAFSLHAYCSLERFLDPIHLIFASIKPKQP